MAGPSASYSALGSKNRAHRFRLSSCPCFVCGTKWASRWTDGARFSDEELMATFGVTGKGILCQGCRAAVYHRRRTAGRKTFFHFLNARRNKTGPEFGSPPSPVRRPPENVKPTTTKKHQAGNSHGKGRTNGYGLHGVGKAKSHSMGKVKSYSSGKSKVQLALQRHGHSRQRAIGPGQACCEFCQGIGRANDFMPSMRFCSLRCSRAYSTQFRSINQAKAIRDLTTPTSPAAKPLTNGRSTLQVSPTGQVLSRKRMQYGKSTIPPERQQVEPPLHFDPKTREYFLDSSLRAPVVLAGFGLMPRTRDENGRLIFRHLPGVDIPVELRRKPPSSWTADECRTFLIHNDLETESDILSEHDVDGAAFLLLKLEHLVHLLGLKVGPALKLAAIARNLSLLCAD